MAADLHFFSEESLRLLVTELHAAIRKNSSGDVPPLAYSDAMADEIVDHALVYYPQYLYANDQGAMLRKLFIRDHLQQYTADPSNSVVSQAGLRLDQTLGRSRRHSAAGTPDERVDPINPVFARGGDVGRGMHDKWKQDRVDIMAQYGRG